MHPVKFCVIAITNARVPPSAESANLNTLGKLVQRLSDSQPQQWCLIGPTGMCHLGSDPLVLAAQATAGRL